MINKTHQPIKSSNKTPSKPHKPVSKAVKKESSKLLPPKKNVRKFKGFKKQHAEYGTSKLEVRFGSEYLDKLGVKYVYQYKAESIGRYYDYMLFGNEKWPNKKCAIEIDGSYWHGDPRLYEEDELNRVQKKARKVDALKDKWCSRNGIMMIRVPEYDINHDPEGVMKMLREKLEQFLPLKK